MLEVYPIQEKEEQKSLCDLCQIAYLPNALAYKTVSDGTLVGICQFSMDSAGGKIYGFGVASQDGDPIEALFVTGRAALNFIDLCGVHRAEYLGKIENESDERLIRAIGFTKDAEGRQTVDLTDFFREPCKHGK